MSKTSSAKLKSGPNSVVDRNYARSIKWPDLLAQIFVHCGALYGIYSCLLSAKICTILFAGTLVHLGGFGVTAGAHRLWSHKAYKAKLPLQLLLLILFTLSGQKSVYIWVSDHRVHHKYTESDADPHDSRKGFIFSHIGWIVLTPHPKVLEKKAVLDLSDLESDRLIMWQHRWYTLHFIIWCLLFPIVIPVYFWDESLWTSLWICFNMRMSITLHFTFLVNSAAHMWGWKPYDKRISPVENYGVALCTLGEGWHNYHHVFPWDYKAGELGNFYNPTTTALNFFAKIGWAYDLKSASAKAVQQRIAKTGDGSSMLD